MYAGKVVEIADSPSLLRKPLHPYTAGLLSSFPALRGPRRPLSGIGGSPPDLRNIPPGCPFHPRCPEATPDCSRWTPVLTKVATNRRVACLLRSDTTAGDATDEAGR
jgi:peptide/nickel transport system ATP-binding protein